MLPLGFMLMELLVIRSKLKLFSSEAAEIPFDRADYYMKLKPEATAGCIWWVKSLPLSLTQMITTDCEDQ